MRLNHTPIMLAVFLLGSAYTYACTCVRNPKWTLKNELTVAEVVVKGKIIGATDYTNATFPWHYKRFTLIIEKTYKAPVNTPDTIFVLTGCDSDAYGYAFKLGKDYIVYGTIWTSSKADNHSRPEKTTHPVFFTDICFLTKAVNRKELAQLKRLTR